jgi:hypothetical protein
MQDLSAGRIDLWFGSPDNLPLVRSGTIKAYAVTSDLRMMIAPDIPTFAEFGLLGVSLYGWAGLFAPKATPKDVIAKLNAAAVDALADPGVRSRLLDFGTEPYPRDQQTPVALHTLTEGFCRQMVADHQGAWDQARVNRVWTTPSRPKRGGTPCHHRGWGPAIVARQTADRRSMSPYPE